MFVLSVALTVLLLLETLPSAAAGLARYHAGLARLDQLTRLGLLEGRNLWAATTWSGSPGPVRRRACSPSMAVPPSDGASSRRGPTWTGWPTAGTSGRWMTCPSGRSRVSTSGLRTAAGASWTP